ncbi:hypothetical protein O4J56_10525 [Nocardiopsis sp. RSe5-2]|uniref:Uncharacterized protein n=1 Tax=Nocardiopsis endophytica TaxID=3018445 RepID=A0ABT4U301_9ACTN|nr:hypothetical protein [Nocardiopsis endophytica]MDA2811071.1 hypothetical protein [Nocardiopsis endophytica]
MKYVEAYRTGDGSYWSNPQVYLERLPELVPDLPEGARAFASEAGHYNYYSRRCVKDLKLARVDLPLGDDAPLRLRFAPNPFKHDAGLTLTYTGAEAFTVDSDDGDGLVGLGDVMLDEVLPAAEGCTHEIAFRWGRVTIACTDLHAEWQEDPQA